VKKIILPLVGFLPLLVGCFLNFLTVSSYLVIPIWFFCATTLSILYLAGRFSVEIVDKRMEAVFLLNTPAFIILLLAFYQEIVLGRYWDNWVGLMTQFFYSPFLRTTMAFIITVRRQQAFYAYVVSFIFLVITTYSGRARGERWH